MTTTTSDAPASGPTDESTTDGSTVDRPRDALQVSPLFLAGGLFLLAGLVLGTYDGLQQFSLVPRVSWVSWSHIHYVTIGGFTQLILGMLPQVAAWKLDRPSPSRRYHVLAFLGLNGGFLTLWYGRAFGEPLAFDLGLVVVWALALGLLLTVLRMALRSDRGWDATVGLFVLSPFVFLWGITYAYGLYAHPWQVPGGWYGLREAHVHANAWGFLGFAAIGTLYVLFPRLVRTDLYSDRLKNYSVWLFAAGIFPLITGPWLGMGKTVTATGLVLYAGGFALYLYDLVRTYRAGTGSGLALWVLAAQFWLLGPAGFAPFVLFGVDLVQTAWIEQGALHFFFVGWALPVALAGVILFGRNLVCVHLDWGVADRADPTDLLPDGEVPRVISRWTVLAWNVAVFVVGLGFFTQDQSWSAILFGAGYSVVIAVWAYALVKAVRGRLRVARDATTA